MRMSLGGCCSGSAGRTTSRGRAIIRAGSNASVVAAEADRVWRTPQPLHLTRSHGAAARGQAPRVRGARRRLEQPKARAAGAVRPEAIAEIIRPRTAQPAEARGGRQPIAHLPPCGGRAPASKTEAGAMPALARTVPSRPLHVSRASAAATASRRNERRMRSLIAMERLTTGDCRAIAKRRMSQLEGLDAHGALAQYGVDNGEKRREGVPLVVIHGSSAIRTSASPRSISRHRQHGDSRHRPRAPRPR
jgi:hypothetical protein